MKNIIVAPVGDNIDALFVGVREFPTERIYLITPPNKAAKAAEAQKNLEKFKIPSRIWEIEGKEIWEETFVAISEIKKLEGDKPIMVNVATGDPENRCAATSGAFVNGIQAFAVGGDVVMPLPVLKFSYYKLLSEKKMGILKLLYGEKDCCSSLEKLGKKTGMSLPLVSYHINGNFKSKGLVELGLVETNETKGRVAVHLTTLGRLLVKGYIPQAEPLKVPNRR